MQKIDPANIRHEYRVGELAESSVFADPIDQFTAWFNEAIAANVAEPTAMTLATADAAGRPDARIVLLKGFDANGFIFYTNYKSRKGRQLAENPRVSLVFFWQPLEREVRIDGRVELVDRATTEAYFHSRPVASQIGAWVSQQSSVVASREELERSAAKLQEKYFNREIPVPDYWGGYRVIPEEIEFWQGRRSRLHDRLRYIRSTQGWTIQRLAP